jgi:predicted nucleic acid-binding protein
MAEIEGPPVVSDAGPIIHLAELGCLDLLRDIQKLLIPQEVWSEIVHHRPELILREVSGASIALAAQNPPPKVIALAASLGLHRGEISALVLMQEVRARLFLTDDAAARLAAEALGFEVHGTIGMLVRAIRMGRRSHPEVLSVLRELPQRSTLHLSAKLLSSIITSVEESES